MTECIRTIMNRAPAGDFSFGGLITFSLFCELALPSASLRPAFGRAASFAARLGRGSVRLGNCSLYPRPAGAPSAQPQRLRQGRFFRGPPLHLQRRLRHSPASHPATAHTTTTHNHSCCWVAAVAPASRDYPCGGNRKPITAPEGLGVGLRPHI